jgi:hypothetical protein
MAEKEVRVFKVKDTIDYKECIRVEFVRTFEELDKFADEWDLLALNAQQQHPALSHAWISAYFKSSLKEGETWFCLFAFDNNNLVGVLPLLSRESRFLGNKCLLLNTPKDSHTMSVDFLFKEKYGKKVIQLFARYLNALRPRVIRLRINKIAYNTPTFNAIAEGIYGVYPSYYQSGYTAIIPVEWSLNDYKNRLSKKFLGNVRRSGNRLQKLGDFSVSVINDRKNARENLLSFACIEKSGWKGRKGTAINDKFWAFFEEFVQNMCEKGWLKWYFLNLGDKRIAG